MAQGKTVNLRKRDKKMQKSGSGVEFDDNDLDVEVNVDLTEKMDFLEP